MKGVQKPLTLLHTTVSHIRLFQIHQLIEAPTLAVADHVIERAHNSQNENTSNKKVSNIFDSRFINLIKIKYLKQKNIIWEIYVSLLQHI